MMSQSKIETTIGMCVIALTRHIMQKEDVDNESAYKCLLQTELYDLLKDPDSRLYLETNDYLIKAYDTELTGGKNALYNFINKE